MSAALSLLFASCRNEQQQQSSVVAGGSDSFLSDTLTDWVSYSTHVIAGTVVSEREIPPPPEVMERGEGYVGRSVTVSVDKVLWTDPSALASPTTVDLIVSGWILRDGKRLPIRVEGGPRLEVGTSYLLPITTRDGAWSMLSSHAIAVLADGVVVKSSEPDASLVALSGLDLGAVSQVLAATPPDPIAQKYRDLPPYERSQAVLLEKQGGG